MQKTDWRKIAEENLKGKVFLLPTDTIYGFSCLWNDQEAEEKIVNFKKRNLNKNFINLISSLDDLPLFDIEISKRQKTFLKKNWPGRVTVILINKKGDKESFRIPRHRKLRKLINIIGPIISTSANISGFPHIHQPSELPKELGEKINFYIDEKVLNNEPSVIVEVLR